MEILGVGAPELLFIIIIAIIILGPRDMQKAGKTIGRFLNKLIRSDGWQMFQKTSAEMRNLPTRLMREANLEMQEAEKDIRKAIDMRQKTGSGLSQNVTPSNPPENSIQPPTVINTPEHEPDSDPEHHD
jgi:sec-independent protein translocase protein TatB